MGSVLLVSFHSLDSLFSTVKRFLGSHRQKKCIKFTLTIPKVLENDVIYAEKYLSCVCREGKREDLFTELELHTNKK